MVAAADLDTVVRMLAGRRVGATVTRVAARLSWHPTCLRKSLAVRWMLRRRQYPPR
jgi:hypothetical protein